MPTIRHLLHCAWRYGTLTSIPESFATVAVVIKHVVTDFELIVEMLRFGRRPLEISADQSKPNLGTLSRPADGYALNTR